MNQTSTSKHSSQRPNEVILLIMADGKKCHYLGVEILCRLSRGIASKHSGDYCCVYCLFSLKTANKHKSRKTFVRITLLSHTTQ